MGRTNNCIAVVDVETTGLSPWRHDRVIEIAVVLLDSKGAVIDEFESLVNPKRDIGPTRIHGITATDVLEAPTFEEIAGEVVDRLRESHVLAGHNVSFDRNFLVKEFERMEAKFPEVPLLCTCRLMGRQKLSVCCEELGIELDTSKGEFHSALYDAHATAEIIRHLMGSEPALLTEFPRRRLRWPPLQKGVRQPLRRAAARARKLEPPGFLNRISERISHDTETNSPEVLTYLSLLDRVLEDRIISADEGNALVDAAENLALTRAAVIAAHTTYLQHLAAQALSDGIVTDAERTDLYAVSRLLGLDPQNVDGVLELTRKQLESPALPLAAAEDFAGKSVCFTGELLCSIGGEPITRPVAQALAKAAGMEIRSGVSKKLDVLVVVDPNSQSGKARKAREYGTRIIAEPVFWKAIGVSVDQYS